MSDADKPEAGRFIRPQDLDNAQRTTLGARIGWGIEAFAWDWVFWSPMKALPIETASNAVAGILKTLGPLTSQHRTMIRNLRMAFPTGTRSRSRTSPRHVETLGRTAGEMPHLAKMKPYVANSRVEVVGAERLDGIRESGKPAVLIGGHFANWEVMASAICNRPLDAQITYRSANNPYIDRRIAEARHAYGINVLTPKAPAPASSCAPSAAASRLR